MNEFYTKFAEVPKDACTPIKGGRLAGMTNINPQWRIEALTEMYGMCGSGWYYEIRRTWENEYEGEAVITVEIVLYVKVDDEWSAPITGIGGSKIESQEKGGTYINDEAYKMAVTDALSVACKQLGIASNIYRGKENNKYDDVKKDNFSQEMSEKITATQAKSLKDYIVAKGQSVEYIETFYKKKIEDFTKGDYGKLIKWLKSK